MSAKLHLYTSSLIKLKSTHQARGSPMALVSSLPLPVHLNIPSLMKDVWRMTNHVLGGPVGLATDVALVSRSACLNNSIGWKCCPTWNGQLRVVISLGWMWRQGQSWLRATNGPTPSRQRARQRWAMAIQAKVSHWNLTSWGTKVRGFDSVLHGRLTNWLRVFVEIPLQPSYTPAPSWPPSQAPEDLWTLNHIPWCGCCHRTSQRRHPGQVIWTRLR